MITPVRKGMKGAAVAAAAVLLLLAQAGSPLAQQAPEGPFIGSAGAKKFHAAGCRYAAGISERNRVYFRTYDEAVQAGFEPCKVCRPEAVTGAAASPLLTEPAAPPIVTGAAVLPRAAEAPAPAPQDRFVGHSKSKKVHAPTCRWATQMSERNRVYFDTYEEAVAAGYTPCKMCRPEVFAAAPRPAAPAPPAFAPAPAPPAFAPARGPAAPAARPAAAPAGAYWSSERARTFHRPECEWARRIPPNLLVTYGTRDAAIAAGRRPCQVCKP